jgi:hypothetical protein
MIGYYQLGTALLKGVVVHGSCVAFDARTGRTMLVVDDDRLSGFNNSYSDRTRRSSQFPSAKSRGLSARMNRRRRRRDLLLVEELSVIGEAEYESSIGSSSSTTNRQELSSGLVSNHREDGAGDVQEFGLWRKELLNPCPQTTEVVWSPEEDGKTTHPKGVNSRSRRVVKRSVNVITESFQPRLSTASIVNKVTVHENEEEEEQCVGLRSPKTKEEFDGSGVRDSSNNSKTVSFVVPSRRDRCCSLYQTSRVFQVSILVGVALILCSIALIGVTIGVRNMGNRQPHSGSASSLRRGSTFPSLTWSDSSGTTPTIDPSLSPAIMQSSIPTGTPAPSDNTPSLLQSNSPASIPHISEPAPTASIVRSSSPTAAPSVWPTNIPSEAPSVLPLVVQTPTEPSKMPSVFSPTATDIFIGPAPPEVNWPF